MNLPRYASPRRIVIAVCTTIILLLLYGWPGSSIFTFRGPNWQRNNDRREAIAEAFQYAWDAYSAECLGHDSITPVTGKCVDDFGGWGVSAIDTLSTAIIFGKENVTMQILEFIGQVNFDVVTGGDKIQLFEVSIRHFAGMLSAWDLLNGPFSHMAQNDQLRQGLFYKMVDLGNRLLCGFDTPSGVPKYWVDPKSCTTDHGTTQSLAAAGTFILEFARLSDITGNNTYVEVAAKAEEHLLNPQPATHEVFPGLVGGMVNLKTGRFTNKDGGWGATSDSFYEYLIKAYMYNSEAYERYLERWQLAASSTLEHLLVNPPGHPDWTVLSAYSGTLKTELMDSLSWFAGGNLILGGMVTGNETYIKAGLDIAYTAHQMYNMTVTGLGAEKFSWLSLCPDNDPDCTMKESIIFTDPNYRLRPEVVETWYYAYRATKNPMYQDWAWSAFESINRYCRVEYGFSSISNVNATIGGTKLDVQESFIFAELFKYLYLIHLDDDMPFHVQDSQRGRKNGWVLNTEAHPLKVVGRPM